jgi:hypothetical protein
MKKLRKNPSEQDSSFAVNLDTTIVRASIMKTSNARSRKRQHTSAVSYEDGDLRGIVAAALAKSSDPYCALLESGVIKNATEFFDSND